MPITRVPVYLHANDPISYVGVAGQLRPRPDIRVLGPEELEHADARWSLPTPSGTRRCGSCDAGAFAIAAACVIDREEGGSEALAVEGIALHAPLTRADLVQPLTLRPE